MSALIAELGLSTFPTWAQGRKVLELAGHCSTYTGTIPRVAPWTLIRLQLVINRLERLCTQVPIDDPWKAERAEEWDAQTLGGWLQHHGGSADVIALIQAAIRVIFGADVGELSFLHFLFYVHSGGGLMKLVETHGGNQDLRVRGGTQQLSERLAAQLPHVVLQAPVRRIVQDEQGIEVHTDAGTWRARRVIVAVPPPLADRIRYEPALPTLRDQLTQRVGMGATIKCFALYERPFWRDQGLSGEGANTEGPVSVTFDNVAEDGRACLLAFVVGRPARGWAERPEAERRQLVLDTFVRYFGEEARSPLDYFECDWATEPFSGGAPIATFPPGSLTAFGPALRAPVGRLHWAGTETARESTGFMEGALESAERVSVEVLAALG